MEMAKSFGKAIINTGKKVGKVVFDVGKKAVKKVVSMAKTGWNAASNMANKAWNSTKDCVKWLADKGGKTMKWVNDPKNQKSIEQVMDLVKSGVEMYQALAQVGVPSPEDKIDPAAEASAKKQQQVNEMLADTDDESDEESSD